MKYSEVKKEVANKFTEKLKPLGFKKINSYTFEKEEDGDFRIKFSTALYDYGCYYLTFRVSLTSSRIGRLSNYLIDEKVIEFYKEFNNIGLKSFNYEKFVEEKQCDELGFEICKQEDIEMWVKAIFDFVNRVAIPNLLQSKNYFVLEQEFNNNLEAKKMVGHIGIILAMLVQRRDINELIEKYKNVNMEVILGPTQPLFNNAVDFVRNHTLEEVLDLAQLDGNLKPLK